MARPQFRLHEPSQYLFCTNTVMFYCSKWILYKFFVDFHDYGLEKQRCYTIQASFLVFMSKSRTVFRSLLLV